MFFVAALIVAVAPSGVETRHANNRSAHALATAANAMSYRTVAGRFTGFEHRPLVASVRGARDADAPGWLTMQLAVVEADRFADSPTIRRRVMGVGLLLFGRTDDAIRSLERGLMETTGADDAATALHRARDARLLSDLSAAYLHRNTIADAFMAAEAAECAWRLQRSPEIAWNRALAREALHVRAGALKAWNDFLTMEPQSPWAVEAAAHVRRIARPSHAQRWPAAQKSMERGGADYPALAREFPQELRTTGEETVLGRWAASILRGSDARESLRAAHEIGEAIGRAAGDHLLADTVAGIERVPDAAALRRLAAALARYAAGRQLYTSQQPIAAANELAVAERLLAMEGSPFAARAALYVATAQYYAGNLDVAYAHLGRTLSDLRDPDRYPSLVGQIEWARGLVDASRGNNNEAAQAFDTALAAFARTGEIENRAGIETLLAGLHRSLGNETAMLADQQQALASLEQLGTTRRSHAILTEAAFAAEALQLPLAALVFQDDLVGIARLSGDPVSVADALISRIRYAAAVGDRHRAEADLRESRLLLTAIPDAGMRARCTSNLLAAEVTVWRTFDPQRAASAARGALAEMERLGHRVVMVHLRLEAGRALRALGRTAEALQSWREGIGECERQRANLATQDERRTYFEQCRALFDESIGALARDGRFAEAWVLAENGRARGLRETLAATSATAISAPPGVTVLEFSILPDALVAWTIGPGGATASIRNVSRRDLLRSVNELVSDDVSPEAYRRHSAALYDLMIRPVESQLARRVVIVPDAGLYRIAFGGLWNRRSGRYFIEEHELSLAPSLALLTSLPATPWRDPRSVVLIDAGNVHNDRGGETGQLPSTAGEIAALARMYRQPLVVSDSRCTKTNVMRALQTGELIHFAGHGLKGSAVIDPALVLRASAGDPGLLYPRDIAGLTLTHARLVVLGACGTADGQVGSEGAMSIARAFMAAGATRVVATLWPVEDDPTRALLTALHRSLRDGVEPAAALRTAQLEAIHESMPPRHWAAFEIIQRGR
jgi:CHAT domain-containing protein